VELLAVDSPVRASTNESRHQTRGILRLRLSSDDELQLNNDSDDDDDDALLSLERQLTTRGPYTYLLVYLPPLVALVVTGGVYHDAMLVTGM